MYDDQQIYEPDEDRAGIPPEAFVQAVAESINIAAEMSEGQLSEIARQVIDDYTADRSSMDDWLKKAEEAVKLASLVKDEKKNYPFEGSANVKFPLLTSAALQFNARAYPAIVASDQVVRAKTFGADTRGEKAARGERVAAHMSYQLMAEIEEWEEDTDTLLLVLPVIGSVFRKVWYDPALGRPRMRLIDAQKFICHSKVTSLSLAPRVTEELDLYPSEIRTRELSGVFTEIEYTPTEDKQASERFIEQHTLLDLDEDGYSEPYIVTVHPETQNVVRIVADFGPEDVRYITEQQMQPAMGQGIDPMTGQPVAVMQMQQVEVVTGIKHIRRATYFVHYKFLPSMDMGLHGTGLGILLGDISKSINTIMNMMLDAGHYNSLGGGFIGSEVRLKGGAQRFKPGEYKTIGAKGQDVRAAVVPVQFGGPDSVMFQMLGFLTDAGREIASVQEIMTGDTGTKNMTATTTLALIEQGMTVFTAAYKRIFRALRQEYKLLAKINAGTVTPDVYNAFHDEEDEQGQPIQYDPAQDYGAADMDIVPVADPRSVTKMQEAAKAQIVLEMAQNGLLDPAEAAMRVLESASISNVEQLLPKPDPMAEPMAMLSMQAAEADVANKKAEATGAMVDVDVKLAQVEKMKAETVSTMSGSELEMAQQRLDGLEVVLKDARERLKIVVQGSTGGVAGKPGNSGAESGDGRSLQGPQGPDVASLLGGPAIAGRAPAGA